ncbi:hypothetical protein CK227_10435 [Mesorhizobium sp. WSM4308]|uniref:portal protein n=1 Tax=Mesorhizobium sp. WSM4308 TaxID=2029409 RepID=UPI000BAEF796|nr:hypothetical protein [Mesorhizobium sp. WSM4308]PBB75200.1 hypothetical protein CK227_10435 [Mesorhizobium sp. WSM4308]
MAVRETTTGLNRRRREFESYATAKANEIDEQRQAWRYYHAAQWTAAQLKTLKDRKQPPITFDRTSRRIDGLVGVVRKLRTDPKAFPKTQQHENSADVATQVVRTVCDQSRFEDIEAECARDGAVHGIGVSELTFQQGDHGDPDFKLEYVDPRSFFYDPRSIKNDFSDARFMGTYKWVGLDELEEMVPGASEKVGQSDDGTYTTAFDTDREMLWIDEKQRVRLVDHWYIEGGKWRWCLHIGTTEIAGGEDGGESPFTNDRGKSLCKFLAFSNLIDHDGDRYGFVRRLKGPQDAMNQHRSKALHIMNTRQIKVRKGALEDVEKTRKEAARPDGVLEYTGNAEDFEVIQPAQEFLQQTEYYQDAKNEIDQFGPNPALLGDLGKSASGRAYTMAQQAGLAELGPFLKNFRMWKLAQYEAIWWTAKRHWTGERFLRITDDEGLAQFMKVNGVELDQFGQPALVNALGSIDVDIVIDEGPDTETVMGDVFDTLGSLAQNKVPVPPAVIIEASNLPGEVKKKMLSMMQQQDPATEAAKQLELQNKDAANKELQSRAMLNMAKAQSEGAPQGQPDDTAKNMLEWHKAQLSALTSIEVARIGAKTDLDSQQIEHALETSLHLSDQAHQRDMAEFQAQQSLQTAQIAAKAKSSSAPRNGARPA